MAIPPVVRVLNGRLAGTEKILPEKGRVGIGYEFWNDVVLRDASTKNVAIDLQLETDGTARVTLLSGAAGLLGSAIEPGHSAVLPPFVPLSVGDHLIAWGDPASARWSEAGCLAARVPESHTPPEPERLIDAPIELLGWAGQALRDSMRGWRPVALVGVALLVTGAYAAAPAVQSLRIGGDGVAHLDGALAEAGLGGLSVSGDVAGPQGLIVSGIVNREGDRVRAQQVMDDEGLAGTVDVQTTADLAAAAEDVARIHGFPASARPIARAAVELRTGPLAPEDRDRLNQAVRGDVAGLKRIVIRDDLPPEDDAPVKTVADVTKKVATVVAGDPAYIQTADGAYYFVGAMMPTGHRLVSIDGSNVLLEKGGRQTRLSF